VSGGAAALNIPIQSRIYLSGNVTFPCPVCNDPDGDGHGTCSRGPNVGSACFTAVPLGAPANSRTSADCQSDGQLQAPLNVTLGPLGTGHTDLAETAAGNGIFCVAGPGSTGQTAVKKGAFGKNTAAHIILDGTPAASPIGTSGPTSLTAAAAFCIGNVSGTIDGVAGLPGPGAISLFVDAQLKP